MALWWLSGAIVLATIGGFLQGRESVPFFYLSLPFAVAAVVAHTVAAGWPPPGRDAQRFQRVRLVFGIVVGALGLVANFSYGVNHLAWFGDRTAAVVSSTREVCGVNDPRCHTEHRVTDADTGADLGFAALCGHGGPVGTRVDVDVDPLGWIPPMSPACTTQHRAGIVLAGLWLAGLVVIALRWVGVAMRRPKANLA